MRAELIDKYGYVVSVLESNNYNQHVLDATVRQVKSWDMKKEPIEYKFFADVYIKFDGCTFFNFRGQDYVVETSKGEDSYYHICGLRNYNSFMVTMLFVYDVMVKTIGLSNIYERSEYTDMLDTGVFNDYKINILDNNN